jgi:methionyl-tRNA synthetase
VKKPTYITTSIAYINAEPHIGFLYELLAADVLKRHHQSAGEEVFLVTGTDEHGVKIAQAIEASGKEPQVYADDVAGQFQALGQGFSVEFDYFIRTTNPDHQVFVQKKWQQLVAAGVLKKKTYSGLYCVGCEAFKTESEIQDGKCTIHERELEKIEEENWFLVTDAATKEKIKTWINESVFPVTRRQEVINVLESGAYDEVSVSRSKEKLSWGVPVPNDETQTMYVWVDALFNYISALAINDKEALWPADVQIIGKDILKFHAIIWPALLLATGYELPIKLLVHGFITSDGKKMSKSLGNVITPVQLKDRYGVEATRYLLFRQLSFFDDSNFVWAEFDALYNGELANGIGNLLARLIGLAKKAGTNPFADLSSDPQVASEYDFSEPIKKANATIGEADAIVTKHKIWESPAEKIAHIQSAGLLLLSASTQLAPYMPETAKEIRRQLNELDSTPLFPRLQS